MEEYDTTGKRLRYFREKETSQSRGKFIEGLGITARTLERYENDASYPDASFLTSLNSKYAGKLNLDWLLTGRGTLYMQPQIKQMGLKEEEGYYDVVLQKMHQQMDRVYSERDFEKLATLQSLLNLIDPGEDHEELFDK